VAEEEVKTEEVKAHETSITVWDVPSPTAFGTEFRIKVGVKCSAECKLTGKEIEIYDHEGVKVATTTLGDVPWPATSALYWTEVELKAPSIEGRYRWTVKFPEPDLELPHERASRTFTFGVARQPEHVITIEVIDEDTKASLKDAHVLLRPTIYKGYHYRVRTDGSGMAKVSMPKGDYQLYASQGDKEAGRRIKVNGDATIRIELLPAEKELF
jgi:hypothetical protein